MAMAFAEAQNKGEMTTMTTSTSHVFAFQFKCVALMDALSKIREKPMLNTIRCKPYQCVYDLYISSIIIQIRCLISQYSDRNIRDDLSIRHHKRHTWRTGFFLLCDFMLPTVIELGFFAWTFEIQYTYSLTRTYTFHCSNKSTHSISSSSMTFSFYILYISSIFKHTYIIYYYCYI